MDIRMLHWIKRIPFQFRVIFFYALFSGVWIAASDRILGWLITDVHQLTRLQTYKGWFFVVASAVLIYFLLQLEEKYRRQAEKDYQNIFDQAIEGFFQSSPDGRFINVNPAMARIYGFASPDEMLREVDDISHQLYVDAQDREVFKNILEKNGRVDNFEARDRRKDGSIIWTSTSAGAVYNASGKIKYYEGFVQDITHRKLSETSLRESEERYRLLIELAPDAITIHRDGKFLYLNPACIRLLGYSSAEELIGKSVLDILHPDYHQTVLDRISLMNMGQRVPPLDEKYIRVDGETVDVEVVAAPFTYQGKPAIQAIARDISERKKAENALKESEISYQGLFNSVSDAIYVQDQDGRFLDVNQGAVQMYGYPKSFFIGKTPDVLGAPGKNDLSQVNKSFKKALTGKSQEFEFWGIRKNGEIFPKEVNLYKGKYLGKDVVIALAQDITSRKQVEQDMQRRLEQLTILHSIATAGVQANNLDELIETITHFISQSLYPDNCGILLYDQTRNTLHKHPSYHGKPIEKEQPFIALNEGICGLVARERKTYYSPDVLSDPHYLRVDLDARSELCVPIQAGQQLIGVINAESTHVNHFTEEDQRLLTIVASEIAISIQKMELLEAEHNRRIEAESLRSAAALLSSSIEIEDVLPAILTSIGKVVSFDGAGVFLLEGNLLKLVATQGLPFDNVAIGSTFRAEEELFTEVQKTGQVLILKDAQQDLRFKNWRATEYIHAWMAIPLTTHNTILGYITLDNTQTGVYTSHHAQLALAFANQAATAIENARLYAEIRKRLKELEILNIVSGALREASHKNEMLTILLEETLKILGLETGSIWVYDTASNSLKQNVASGWLENLPEKQIPASDGITGEAFRTGEICIIDEFCQHPSLYQPNRSHIPENWSGAGIPLRTSHETVGTMLICAQHPRRLTTDELALLSTLSEIAGSAIHRASLYEQTELQVNRLTSLRDIDTAIASSFDLRVTLEIFIEHVMSQLKPDATDVLLYNPHLQTLSFAAGHGFIDPEQKRLHLRIGEGLAGKAVLERKLLNVSNMQGDPRARYPQHIVKEGFRVYHGIPLVAKGQIKGILETFHRSEFVPPPEWLEFLQILAGQAAIAIDNAQLFDNLQKSNQDLIMAYDTTLEGWSKALELRDKETQGHTLRVADLTVRTARRLRINEADMVHVRRGALLHDIGKMGIPDEILLKPEVLNDEERTIMAQHPQYAYDLLRPIQYLRPALDIPYCHHEHWDGSGYPRGLKGEDIPLAARIFSVVDVYDALTNERPYRKAWTKERVLEHIRNLSGIHFDPVVVESFLQMIQNE
jgi:PAS domain S-box-containing protein/putative nucleotidyltransferase with HDIG domain